MDRALDVCILGDGITGCALALALAQQGKRVGLVGRKLVRTDGRDVRAYSINAHAQRWLESLQAWPSAPHAGQVRQMSVWGDGGRSEEHTSELQSH